MFGLFVRGLFQRWILKSKAALRNAADCAFSCLLVWQSAQASISCCDAVCFSGMERGQLPNV